jgi:cell division septal protein FtsQ
MKRIEAQMNKQVSLAKEVLLWITYTRRTHSTTELQHALAVEVGKDELDEDNLR